MTENYNYDRKDLDDKIFCAKCSNLVEETLLLTCEHNLCLPCAAKNLMREENKNIHKYKVSLIYNANNNYSTIRLLFVISASLKLPLTQKPRRNSFNSKLQCFLALLKNHILN